ncbi:MAG: FHA domain-containing protein [Cyanobacteria bacterium CRU_2_1]|nr:FHA domain-containing protein [Cyanobacteria bacterium RU_5_0]NJR58790.1 FHA domain-containing protein [Cyanobacteria bacterium CRU_2_1]
MLKLKSVNFEQQQFQFHELDQAFPGQLEWVIGRNTTCDLVLPCPEVSRVHGRIFYSEGIYQYVDVGSTSGTLLNGEVVPANEKHLLHPGDLLQLGETFLHVEELTPPALLESSTETVHSAPVSLPEKQWTEGDLECRCSRIIDETPDVKTFCFVAEPPVMFNYKPGQFVNLKIEIDGKPVIRSYSISSSPSRPYHLSLTVKRVPSPPEHSDLPPGVVSNWLHDNLKVGDRVKFLTGPLGHFTCLPEMPTKMLLISAGSGITPMMSMSRWVQDTLADCDIVFLHSSRTLEDIIFRAELEAMAVQMSNFHLAVTLTQQPLGRSWMGLTGRISKAMLYVVAPDLLDRAVFVCGPNGFMQGIKSTLESMNFPMQNYKEESFGGKKVVPPSQTQPAPTTQTTLRKIPATAISSGNGKGHPSSNGKPPAQTQSTPQTGVRSNAPVAASNGKGAATQVLTPTKPAPTTTAPAVNFCKSAKEIPADGNTTILELADQEGVQINNACRVGACGACKVLARQGKVRYDSQPMALTAKDQEAGYVLACVAYPVDRLTVEA